MSGGRGSSVERDLAALACEAPPLVTFRERALRMLQHELDAEVGLFVTVAPTGSAFASCGLAPILARLERGWDGFGAESAFVQAEARRLGATTDRRVLGRALERTRIFREVMAPVGGFESLFVVPTLGQRKLGFVMLGRTGRRRFGDAEVLRASELAPSIAVCCAALLDARRATFTPGLERLTARGRELLEYVELGFTTREIALARGTSPYTVRNQLSALYRQLGVANRAEAAGLRARRG